MKTSIAVADRYDYVVGVDTHAASHAYAVVATGTGRLLAERSFPTTTAGRSRAATWITKHTRQTPHGVLVAMEGTGSYGATLSADLLEAGYRVVEAPTPERSRRKAKTDQIDAIAAARSTVGTDIGELRDARYSATQQALALLVAARDRATEARTAAINALHAIVRVHELGIDARRTLTPAQLAEIAAWRERPTDDLVARLARREAVHLARQAAELTGQLAANETEIEGIVHEAAPQLLEEIGIGPVTAAVALITWSYPGRIRTKAAFKMIAGTCPIPAESGNKNSRKRLNRGGDRRLNRALHLASLTRMTHDPETLAYTQKLTDAGKTRRDIRRHVKNVLAGRIYQLLENPPTTTT